MLQNIGLRKYRNSHQVIPFPGMIYIRVGEVVIFSTLIPSGMRDLLKKFKRDLFKRLKISQNNKAVKFFDEKISHSKDITLLENTESRLAE